MAIYLGVIPSRSNRPGRNDALTIIYRRLDTMIIQQIDAVGTLPDDYKRMIKRVARRRGTTQVRLVREVLGTWCRLADLDPDEAEYQLQGLRRALARAEERD